MRLCNLKRNVKTFVLFFLAGLVGLSAALYVSSFFLKPTRAQSPPNLELPPISPPNPDPPSEMPLPTLPQIPTDPNLALPSTAEGAPTETKPSPSITVDGNSNRNLLEGVIEEYNYEVSGRRDPFLPYTSPKTLTLEEEEEIVSPLQRFELDQLKLVGIIWDTKRPKAMFLDPQGKGYIIGKLDKVGRNRGYIAEIREGEVIVLERFIGEGRSTFQTKAIRLERQ